MKKRTTVYINQDLLTKVHVYCRLKGVSFSEWVEKLIKKEVPKGKTYKELTDDQRI